MPTTPWWGTRENLTLVVKNEYAAMQHAFANTFTLCAPASWERIYWQGIVNLNMQGIEPRSHTLKILYPHNFPNEAPLAFVIEPKIRSRRFQYDDGHLSLFNPKDGVDYGWNPSVSTAATIAVWAIQWLYCYYTYKLIGAWPDA